MNWNFMMAGTASTNPLLFAIAIALILAWKVAGYYGLDQYVLPALGTPWQLGAIYRGFRGRPAATATGIGIRA
jgi:thiosulfate dehydrogenase (quinone) large subunit